MEQGDDGNLHLRPIDWREHDTIHDKQVDRMCRDLGLPGKGDRHYRQGASDDGHDPQKWLFPIRMPPCLSYGREERKEIDGHRGAKGGQRRLVRNPSAPTPTAPVKQTKSDLCHFTPYRTVSMLSQSNGSNCVGN